MLGMAKRAADNNPNDGLIRTPQYSTAQRFNKPGAGPESAGDPPAGEAAPPVGTTTPFDQQPSVIKSDSSSTASP